MNRNSVKMLLKYLSASFPNQLDFPKGSKKQDKLMIGTWHDWLKPIPENKAKTAIKQAAFDNPQWIPSPAKILKAVQKIDLDYPSASKAFKLAQKRSEYLLEKNRNSKSKADIEAMNPDLSEEEITEKYNQEKPEKVEVPDIIKDTLARFDGVLLNDNISNKYFVRNQFMKTYKEVVKENESEHSKKHLNLDNNTRNLESAENQLKGGKNVE